MSGPATQTSAPIATAAASLTRAHIIAKVSKQVARAAGLIEAAELATIKRGAAPIATLLANHGSATGEEVEMAEALLIVVLALRNAWLSADEALAEEGQEIIEGVIADDRVA